MIHVGPLYEMPPEDYEYIRSLEVSTGTHDTARSPDMRVTWTDYFGEKHEIKFEGPCSYESTLIFPVGGKEWTWNDGETQRTRFPQCDWV